ncbi:zinc finger transcription factor YY1-like isoform X2 [Syzygium oleosum]|uniref:zinc finger transcription factor YY1-like isoform X2 n=1 Tax=Syzygium oleosum TaxID=219896 RepID=UPI0024B913C3|nr:zinc finger transcription factor YY1-like isoform X2 [Syzygium oleosum]
MESHYAHHNSIFDRRPFLKAKTPAVKWVKQWVPQDVVATGGKCYLLKWVSESTLKALNEKEKEPKEPEPEPEPTTEVLFLCSYEGCGKTFIDAGALRKHSHIHGERQYVCHYEGCGKAFSLDFNLRSHMKTHSQENYHICPYSDCGKRYAHEYKLKNHIASQHEKNAAVEVTKYTPPPEKITTKASKPSSGAYGSASSDRPYACPYETCDKAYIHEYKLKLHLRREHPEYMADENAENATRNVDHEMDEASDQDNYSRKRANGKSQKQSRQKPNLKTPPAKSAKRKGAASPTPVALNVVKKPWPVKEDIYEEEDSEETEEDQENVEGWRYAENNEDDDEETEYED